MAYSWAKLWIEMIDDRKTASLPDSSWRRFVECILLAMETNREGVLPAIPDMAWRLRVTPETLADDMTRLALAGLVHLNEFGEWVVSNFVKRQAAVPVTERVASHRERKRREKRSDGSGAETPEQRESNADVTDETPIGNEPVTIRSTDKTRRDNKTRREERRTGATAPLSPRPASPVPISPELQEWFIENEIPTPQTEDDLALIQSPVGRSWLNVTMRWPGWKALRQIAQTVGPVPDEAALKRVWEAWTLNGYSLSNIAGVLERYKTEAGRGATSSNGHGRPTAPPVVLKEIAPGLY